MVRIKRGNVARKRRKKILSLAKGSRGAHSVLFRVANQQVMKALRYSYVGNNNAYACQNINIWSLLFFLIFTDYIFLML